MAAISMMIHCCNWIFNKVERGTTSKWVIIENLRCLCCSTSAHLTLHVSSHHSSQPLSAPAISTLFHSLNPPCSLSRQVFTNTLPSENTSFYSLTGHLCSLNLSFKGKLLSFPLERLSWPTETTNNNFYLDLEVSLSFRYWWQGSFAINWDLLYWDVVLAQIENSSDLLWQRGQVLCLNYVPTCSGYR